MTGDLQSFLTKGFSVHGRETIEQTFAGAVTLVRTCRSELVLSHMGGEGGDRLRDTSNRLEAARGFDWLAGHPDAQDSDACPVCGGSFEAAGGKPERAPFICQRCHVEALLRHPIHTSGGEGEPTRQGLAFGPDRVTFTVPRCQHPQFTAMKGRPETARCDDCGAAPDLDGHSRIRIRYVETIGDLLN